MPVGSRVRANNVYGSVADNPLLIGAVSFTSIGLKLLPAVVAPDQHAVIVLDPKRVNGAPEIVVVTSHLSMGTTATITRGQYGTTARAHPQDTAWAHIPVGPDDYIAIVTSSTRPSDPYIGEFIYETDTSLYKSWNGLTWVSVGTGGSGGASTLAYAEITTPDQTFTAQTDLTGLTVTITVPAGRRIRITGQVRLDNEVAAANTAFLEIREGTTTLQQAAVGLTTTATAGELNIALVQAVISPTAGSHTYKLTGNASAFNVVARYGTIHPGFILVEDVTGSETPFSNSSVPVGQLAYAQVTTPNQTLTVSADLTGLSVNVSVAAGRVIRITGQVLMNNENAAANNMFLNIQEGATVLAQGEVGGTANAARGEIQTNIVQVVISPTAGSHTYKLVGTADLFNVIATYSATNPGFILVEDITPTPAAGTGSPGSTLGYAEVVANQGTFTAETDLTGLSVQVTVPAGRRIRVVGRGYPSSSVNADEVVMRIKEGATVLQQGGVSIATQPRAEQIEIAVILSPTAGTHTYKLSMLRNTGTGNITNNASATFPSYILVEDITGAVFPAGTVITSGLIANETWTTYVSSLDQGVTNISKTSSYARYYRIGKMVTVQFYFILIGTGTASNTVAVSLPFAAVSFGAAGDRMIVGTGQIFDTSASLFYQGLAVLNGGTGVSSIVFYPTNAVAGVGTQFLGLSQFTAALAVNDVVTGSVVYEAGT